MADVNGLVSDPGFLALDPASQRQALTRVTGDQSFSGLSDADTKQFIQRLSPRKGTPITDTSTIGPAKQPSLYQEATAPVRQVAAPIINSTLGALPFVGKYMQMDPTPAPGTAISNIENMTQQGRAQHPWAAKFGDVLKNAGEYSNMVAPEAAALGTADMLPWMRDVQPAGSLARVTGKVGNAFRSPVTGQLNPFSQVIAHAVGAGTGYEAGKEYGHPMEGMLLGGALGAKAADAIIPASGAFREASTANELESGMQNAWDARQKELADTERMRNQDAQSRMVRERQQGSIDRQSARDVAAQAKINQPKPFSGTTAPQQQPAIPQGNYATPAQELATRQAAAPLEVGRSSSAQQPFEPLVYASPEEAAQNDFRMANLKRQASSAGTYHAAQGAAGKRTNLQQRIGKSFLPWMPPE